MSSVPMNDDDPSWLLPAFDLIDPAAWQDTIAPERAWTLHEWIPARQATYLTGPGSAGKSLLAQQLATCVAMGLPFLGIETRQTPSIYLTCEDDQDELHRRQLAICKALRIEPRALAGKMHLISLSGTISSELAVFDTAGRMGTTEAYNLLRGTIMQTGAGFVALDNVAQLFAGNENIRNQVAAFCGLLNSLAAQEDASVLFLGHPNKAGDTFSGSTAWENQVRSRIYLDRIAGADGEPIDPDERLLSRAKANYSRNGEQVAFRWHEWAFALNSMIPSDQRAELAEVALASSANAAFLACLKARASQGDGREVGPAPGPNYAPSQFVGMPEAKGHSKKTLKAAMDRLYALGKIETRSIARPGKSDQKSIISEVVKASPNAPRTPPEHCSRTLPNSARTSPEASRTSPEASRTHTVYTTYIKAEPSPWSGAPTKTEPLDEPDWSSGTLSDDDYKYSDNWESDNG